MTNPRTIDQTVFYSKRAGHYVLASTVVLLNGREYETMVFMCRKDGVVQDWADLDCVRSPITDDSFFLDAAKSQHNEMVAKWFLD